MMSSVSNLIGAPDFPVAVTKIGLGLKPVLPFFEEDGHAYLAGPLVTRTFIHRVQGAQRVPDSELLRLWEAWQQNTH